MRQSINAAAPPQTTIVREGAADFFKAKSGAVSYKHILRQNYNQTLKSIAP